MEEKKGKEFAIRRGHLSRDRDENRKSRGGGRGGGRREWKRDEKEGEEENNRTAVANARPRVYYSVDLTLTPRRLYSSRRPRLDDDSRLAMPLHVSRANRR